MRVLGAACSSPIPSRHQQPPAAITTSYKATAVLLEKVLARPVLPTPVPSARRSPTTRFDPTLSLHCPKKVIKVNDRQLKYFFPSIERHRLPAGAGGEGCAVGRAAAAATLRARWSQVRTGGGGTVTGDVSGLLSPQTNRSF